MLGFLLLAAAAHAENPIQIENAKPGTAGWERSPWTSNHEIEGYASLTSVARGQTINLHISTSAPSYDIKVYRIGWYGGAGARLVHSSPTLTGVLQAPPSTDPITGLIECNWTNPYALAIPSDWVSGIYLAKLTALNTDYQNYIIFVVRDDASTSQFLYQAAVTTWQAYNNWGGKSLYFPNELALRAKKVSFNRPYFASSGGSGDFTMAEIQLVRFLEKEGYDLSYATNVDLHEQGVGLITPHKAFLSVGHDEYWSYQMKSAAHQAREQGRNLVFFGSNAVYWQARFEPSTLPGAAPNRTLVSYKESAEFADPYWLDADASNDKYVTTRFRDLPAEPYNVVDDVAQPENGLIGVMYHGDPFNGDIVISNASHWAFDGTGLVNDSHLAGMLGYENDSIFDNGYSPPGLVTLATSPDTWGNANMTIYAAESGALVFATGSIQWSWGLDDYGVNPAWDDPLDWGRSSRLSEAAKQTTRNILNRFAIIKPGAPLNPLAIRGNAQATVTFSAPASDGGGVITGYTVVSDPPGGVDQQAGSTELVHTVTNLTNGTPYTFTVRAANIAGTGPPSVPSNSVTPSTAPTLPGRPTGVTALAGSAQAAVSFSAPASDGGAPIDGYTVVSNPPGGIDLHAGVATLSHVVTNLTNGVSYTFTVTAHNSAGTGLPSQASAPVIPATVPGKPRIGIAAAGNGQATVYFSTPASDGGRPITGYTVVSNPEGRSSSGCLASPCSVTGLTNGTAYEFRVAASNSFGQGAWSDPSPAAVPTATLSSPSMTAAAAMATARRNHSATLLNDGKLLVVGGIGSAGNHLASAEIYDPATNLWTPAANPSTARSSHAAALLPNGKVLVAGGENQSVLAGAELYDPIANTWSPAGALTTARCKLSATLLANGKVLAAGGQNCEQWPDTDEYASAELYDPAANAWSSAGNMNSKHESHLAARLPDGKVLVVGDWWQNAHAELYDPAGNDWSSAADLPSGQYGAAGAVLADGKVLFAGGWANSSYLSAAKLYDPAANSWSAAANMQSVREWHSATALLDGRVLVAGGITSDAGSLAPTELYDPATNTWSAASPLANGRIYHSATRLANGKVAIAGGQAGVTLSSLELYDPGTPLALPQAPRAVVATGGNGQASVSFQPPLDNGGSAISGYTVVSNPPGGVDQQAGGAGLTHTITGLANGTAYTFTVRAQSGLGTGPESVPSNSVTPAAAPLAATGAASAIGATSATVAGTVTARGAAATLVFDYGLSAAYGSVANATPATTTALYAGTASANLSGLACNTTYHYRLRASSSAGNASGDDATFKTGACPSVPGAPAIVSIVPGAGRATVSFQPPASAGGSAITGYTATCSAPGRATRSASGAASPITVNGLAGGVTYSCTVSAQNASGSGAPSSASTVRPKANILPALMLLLMS